MTTASQGLKLQRGHKFRHTKYALSPLLTTETLQKFMELSPLAFRQTVLGSLDLSPGVFNLGCIDLFLPVSYDSDG